MNLPPFVYSKAFWTALSYALAGVLALLVFFGVIPPEWGLSAGALLAFFLMVLSWFGIEPELRARQLLDRQEQVLYSLEQYNRELRSPTKPSKKSSK